MTRFVYVLPAGRLRWEVRVDSPVTVRETNPGIGGPAELLDWGEPLSLFYRRKAHALIAARAIAIIIGGEVQPHNRWGRIQDPSSFGGDSPRRRG